MIRHVKTNTQYRVIYKAVEPSHWWAADIVAEVLTMDTDNYMWSKQELVTEMKKRGWEPGTIEGYFVHRQTNKGIDINARDSQGVIWLRYAGARISPSPF